VHVVLGIVSQLLYEGVLFAPPTDEGNDAPGDDPAMRILSLSLVLLVCLICACASVKVVDCSQENWYGGCKEIGFEYHPAKPHLLVHPGENGAVATLISLPDVNQKRAKLENGMLQEFGQKSDSKGPETISAIGSSAPSIGSLIAGGAGAAAAGSRTTVTRKPVSDQLARVQSVQAELAQKSTPLKSIGNELAGSKGVIQLLTSAQSFQVASGEDISEKIAASNSRFPRRLSSSRGR